MAWFTDALVVMSRFKNLAYRLLVYILIVFAIAFPLSRILIDQMIYDQFTSIIENIYNGISADLNATYATLTTLDLNATTGTVFAPYGQALSSLADTGANATAAIQAGFNETSIAYMVVISPFEALLLQVKLSLYIGIMATLPVIGWLIWKVAKRRIKMPKLFTSRSAIAWTVLGVVLFLVGFLYTYWVMLPIFINIMLNFGLDQGVLNTYQLSSFVNFIFITTLLFSIAFELPVFIHMVVRLRMMKIETLAHYRRHAYVIILFVAALITADVSFITQSLIGFPMIGLYEATVQYEKFAQRRRLKREAAVA